MRRYLLAAAMATGFPAGLAMSGRAAADSSSLKLDFSGCFCFAFSAAGLDTLLLATVGLTSLGGGVAATAGVEGALPAGEAPEPGVPAFSWASCSACLRFFHSISLAARSAILSSFCFSGSTLSSRAALPTRSYLSEAGVAEARPEPGRRGGELRRLSLSSRRSSRRSSLR